MLVVMMLVVGSALTGAQEKGTRNPFKVKDVSDPDGADVKAFAAKTKLEGGAKDPNAKAWTEEGSGGKKGSLDGEWGSRWKGKATKGSWITGTARVKTIGARFYILYSDRSSTFLIDARRDGKKLVGRFVNNSKPKDTSPFVGVVVDDERIDGMWAEGRWDFRRKLTAEK